MQALLSSIRTRIIEFRSTSASGMYSYGESPGHAYSAFPAFPLPDLEQDDLYRHDGRRGEPQHTDGLPQDALEAGELDTSFANDFAAGLIGGSAGLVFGHPFDTIKVRQQTGATGSTHMWACIKSTLKANGVRGLYRGMAFPLVAVGGLNSIFFGVYGNSMKMLCPDQEAPSYWAIFLAGGFAGTVQAIPACPMELVKVQLQSQTGVDGRQFKGPVDCFRSIYKQEGVRGCFRGLPATVMRELPGFSVYITTYQYMCDRMASQPGQLPGVPSLLLAGGLAGVISWTGNIPIDIIKSRLQADNPTNPQYKGFIDCARKSYQREGLRVFWRGLPVTCLRAFPTNAVTFAVYSTALKAIQQYSWVDGESEL